MDNINIKNKESTGITAIDFPSRFTAEQIEYIGQYVVNAARRICGDELQDVILYGSYARGDYNDWSDVDIMVLANADNIECKQFDERLKRELSDLTYRMNLLLSFTVKPYERFLRFKNDLPYYRNVIEDGIHLC